MMVSRSRCDISNVYITPYRVFLTGKQLIESIIFFEKLIRTQCYLYISQRFSEKNFLFYQKNIVSCLHYNHRLKTKVQFFKINLNDAVYATTNCLYVVIHFFTFSSLRSLLGCVRTCRMTLVG